MPCYPHENADLKSCGSMKDSHTKRSVDPLSSIEVSMPTTHEATYRSMGVDTQSEELGLHLLTQQIEKTWPLSGFGAVKLKIGSFANVLDIGSGLGLAISADGVGSK